MVWKVNEMQINRRNTVRVQYQKQSKLSYSEYRLPFVLCHVLDEALLYRHDHLIITFDIATHTNALICTLMGKLPEINSLEQMEHFLLLSCKWRKYPGDRQVFSLPLGAAAGSPGTWLTLCLAAVCPASVSTFWPAPGLLSLYQWLHQGAPG